MIAKSFLNGLATCSNDRFKRFRIFYGQHPPHDCVYQAENCRISANTQGNDRIATMLKIGVVDKVRTAKRTSCPVPCIHAGNCFMLVVKRSKENESILGSVLTHQSG